MQTFKNRIDAVYTCQTDGQPVTKYYECYETKKQAIKRAIQLQERYQRVSVSLDMMP